MTPRSGLRTAGRFTSVDCILYLSAATALVLNERMRWAQVGPRSLRTVKVRLDPPVPPSVLEVFNLVIKHLSLANRCSLMYSLVDGSKQLSRHFFFEPIEV